MPQLLPLVPSIALSRFATVLGPTTYVFDQRWNGADESWYLDLYDDAEDPIRCGMRVVLGSLLGRRSADPRFPPGVLCAYDLSGAGREATFDDLGTRVVVYFSTPAEFLGL